MLSDWEIISLTGKVATNPKVTHDLAIGHRANGDKHLEQLTLRQVLREVIDDEVAPRVIVASRVGASRGSCVGSCS